MSQKCPHLGGAAIFNIAIVGIILSGPAAAHPSAIDVPASCSKGGVASPLAIAPCATWNSCFQITAGAAETETYVFDPVTFRVSLWGSKKPPSFAAEGGTGEKLVARWDQSVKVDPEGYCAARFSFTSGGEDVKCTFSKMLKDGVVCDRELPRDSPLTFVTGVSLENRDTKPYAYELVDAANARMTSAICEVARPSPRIKRGIAPSAPVNGKLKSKSKLSCLCARSCQIRIEGVGEVSAKSGDVLVIEGGKTELVATKAELL